MIAARAGVASDRRVLQRARRERRGAVGRTGTHLTHDTLSRACRECARALRRWTCCSSPPSCSVRLRPTLALRFEIDSVCVSCLTRYMPRCACGAPSCVASRRRVRSTARSSSSRPMRIMVAAIVMSCWYVVSVCLCASTDVAFSVGWCDCCVTCAPRTPTRRRAWAVRASSAPRVAS